MVVGNSLLPTNLDAFSELQKSSAANGLPVVCTKKAGLPDHLGDCAVWVDGGNPEQLAARIMDLLECRERRRELGARLLERARDCLSWDVIAERTLTVYRTSARKRAASG